MYHIGLSGAGLNESEMALSVEKLESRRLLARIEFVEHPIVEAEVEPYFYAAGDIDGDQDLDVLVAGRCCGGLGWFENLGEARSFSRFRRLEEQRHQHDGTFDILDVDGDGDNDVVNKGKRAVYLSENLGSGKFATPKLIARGEGALELTDLDGDGDLDLVGIADDVAYIRVNTDGEFDFTPEQYLGDARVIDVVDVDGDGRLDVVAGHHRLRWYRNSVQGFIERYLHDTSHFLRDVRGLDVDGDGDVDIVEGRNQQLSWYENLGDGAVSPERKIIATDYLSRSIEAGDIDGDGDVDLLNGGPASGLSWAGYERDTGTFSIHPVDALIRAGKLADLDGDGDIDVFTEFSWYENLGQGRYAPEQSFAEPGEHDELVGAVDMDGDGDVDLLTNSHSSRGIAWYENTTGWGEFERRWRDVEERDGLQMTDILGDGQMRIVPSRSHVFGDIDGDGPNDLVQSIRGPYYTAWVRWSKNTPTLDDASWAAQAKVTGRVTSGGTIVIRDVDGDGDADVVYADSNSVRWYPNSSGRGHFGKAVVVNADSGPLGEATLVSQGDVDNDGRIDLVVVGPSRRGVYWYRYTGNGFEHARKIAESAGPSGLVVEDMDRDGDLDIVLTHQDYDAPHKLIWLEQRETGVFQRHDLVTAGDESARSLIVADIDGDGDQDIAVTFRRSWRMTWYESRLVTPLPGDTNRDGVVAFTDFLLLARNYEKTNAVWADGDFDGDARVTFSDFLLLAENFGRVQGAD